ncbi:MAG: inorganic phosphate transporter, partial [bacterium]
ALIGSVLGVGIASALLTGQGIGSGVNWTKAQQVGLSLLVSPLVGFMFAGGLLLLCKALVHDRQLYEAPHGDTPPPLWIRLLLITTCTGVSFAHGSNDGQKGVGLIMLILIGILPTHFALNPQFDAARVQQALTSVERSQSVLAQAGGGAASLAGQSLEQVRATFASAPDVQSLPAAARTALRAGILRADSDIQVFLDERGAFLSSPDRTQLDGTRQDLRGAVDFVVTWAIIAVALALGLGTMVGWKRIVVTVGEKIGKTHLTYAQGASAELVAMITIAVADIFGLPVSTTHVLSSGVAGTMVANRSGLQVQTVRNVAIAWLLTLPATVLIAGFLFASTASGMIKEYNSRQTSPPAATRQVSTLP